MIYQALQAPNRGRWYKVSPAPEKGLLTVHKTHYDKVSELYDDINEQLIFGSSI